MKSSTKAKSGGGRCGKGGDSIAGDQGGRSGIGSRGGYFGIGSKGGVAIFCIALACRLLFLWDMSDAPFFDVPVVDAFVYHQDAESLVDGKGFQDSFFFQPFLYPAFLSAVYGLFGVSVLAAKLIQALIGALTCLLVWHLGRRIFGGGAGLIAGLIAAFYGPMLFFEGELLATGLAAFLMVVLVLLFMKVVKSESKLFFLLLGASGAVCTLTRPTFLPVVMACMIWLWFAHRRAKGSRAGESCSTGSSARGSRKSKSFERKSRERESRAGRASLFAIALLGFLIPVSIVGLITREHTGHLTFLPSSGGINFYLGNNENYSETVNARMGSEWSDLLHLPEKDNVPGDDQSRSSYYWHRAWDYAFSRPGAFLSGMGEKALQLVSGREIPRNVDLYLSSSWSWMLKGLLWKIGGFGFPFGLLFPLAVVGWFLRRREIPFVLLLSLVVYGVSVVAVFVTARYRIPLIPLFCILAAGGVIGLFELARQRRMKRLASAVLILIATFLLGCLPGPFVAERMDYEPELYCCIGDSLRRSGKPDEALHAFEKAVRIAPDHAEAQAELAQLYAAKGRIDDAIEACRTALKIKPNMVRVLGNLGSLLSDRGDHDEAIEVLKRGLALRPSDPSLHFNLAKALAGKGDVHAAEKQLEETLEADPGNASALFEMARIREREGRIEEAVTLFEKAARIEPDAENCGTLAGLYARMGRFEDALRWFEAGLDDAPDFPPLLHGAARALERMGRLEEASAYQSKLLRLAPAYPRAAYDLGSLLLKLGRYDDAVSALRKAVDADPGAPEPCHMLAVALVNTGRGREAVDAYAKALKTAPDFVPSLSGLAWLRATHPDAALRDDREAMRLAEQAYELDPGNPNVLNTLAAACAESGRFVAAVENAEKAVTLAERSGQASLAAQIRERLAFYKRNKPFRDSSYND